MQRLNLWYDNKGVIHETLADNGRYVLYSEAKSIEEERGMLRKKIDLLLGELELAKQESYTLKAELAKRR